MGDQFAVYVADPVVAKMCVICIFKKNPSSPGIMTFLCKPTKLILEFYYMSNGLAFEIFIIIPLTSVRICLENSIYKISKTSVQN